MEQSQTNNDIQDGEKSRLNPSTKTYYQLVIHTADDDYKRVAAEGIAYKPTENRSECVQQAMAYAMRLYEGKFYGSDFSETVDTSMLSEEYEELRKLINDDLDDCKCAEGNDKKLCLCAISPENRENEELLSFLYECTAYGGEFTMITWDYSIHKWEL